MIKDRVNKVIQAEQLTPTKFADAIGVQRSSISHILSGRNNPSLEFIQKILTSFSNLSSDWLLFGRGQMYNDDRQRTAFPNEQPTSDTKQPASPPPSPSSSHNPPPDESPEPPKSDTTEGYGFAKHFIDNQENKSEKRIERIVIIYNDSTFREYKPE